MFVFYLGRGGGSSLDFGLIWLPRCLAVCAEICLCVYLFRGGS